MVCQKGRPVKKQDRAIRTRERLLESAGEEFDKNGYLATRLADISARAGVTRGSLYFHFDSKADIAEALVIDKLETWIQYIPKRREEGFYGIELLMIFAHDLVVGFRDDTCSRAAMRIIKNSSHVEKEIPSPFPIWLCEVSSLLEEAKGLGQLRESVDVDKVSWVIVAGIFGIQEIGDQFEQRQHICEYLDSMWVYLLPGLGVDDPLKCISNVIAAT